MASGAADMRQTSLIDCRSEPSSSKRVKTPRSAIESYPILQRCLPGKDNRSQAYKLTIPPTNPPAPRHFLPPKTCNEEEAQKRNGLNDIVVDKSLPLRTEQSQTDPRIYPAAQVRERKGRRAAEEERETLEREERNGAGSVCPRGFEGVACSWRWTHTEGERVVTPAAEPPSHVGGGCCRGTLGEEAAKDAGSWRGSSLLEHFNIWQGPLRSRGWGARGQEEAPTFEGYHGVGGEMGGDGVARLAELLEGAEGGEEGQAKKTKEGPYGQGVAPSAASRENTGTEFVWYPWLMEDPSVAWVSGQACVFAYKGNTPVVWVPHSKAHSVGHAQRCQT
ncbi:hypothetical protein WN48_04905 [Eufriesea mexicana]|uniref:Uncharacterized protein n=1 Tax=Eufriesea mexicana TaxID=516756 RepID=A0A310S9L1_9HYME|nr:hypothetical protein WN48_04905 [Eufriesea mexicana]